MASTDAVHGPSTTNVTTLTPPPVYLASRTPTLAGDHQLARSADASELPLADAKLAAVEPPLDIEHVLVQDDPRKWSPFRKVR